MANNSSPIPEQQGLHGTDVRLERRRDFRSSLHAPVDASFYNNGELYLGILENLSKRGACLTIIEDQLEHPPLFADGQSIECYVSSKFGRSKFRGIIQRIQKKNVQVYLGISFIELSHYPNDPFRKLIAEIDGNREVFPVTGMAVY